MPLKIFRRRALIVWSIAIVALVILMYSWFSRPEKTEYMTVPVVMGDIEESVLASGQLEAFKQVDVGAQVSGQLKSLKVALGDSVKKGQLLAEIDPVLQQNALKEAEAALKEIQAQERAKQALRKQYQLALKRQQDMIGKGASSRADLENAEAQLATTEADLAALDAQTQRSRVQVDTARANLGYTQIEAPIDGRIISIVTQEGQTVVSAQQAPTILKMADLDTITVKAQISEADVIKVKPGQVVYFTVLGDPDRRFYSHLRAVEPAPDTIKSSSETTSASSATAIYYNGLFEVANPDQVLRVSMTAQVSIVLSEVKNVLTVPVAALGERDADGFYSIRVLPPGDKAVPQSRKIHLGVRNNVNAEVLEGLAEGEKVIIGDSQSADRELEGGSDRPPPPER